MLKEKILNKEFESLMQKHVQELMIYMFENDIHFGVVCNIEGVSFSPSLPEEIEATLQDMTLFFLAGYTFESAMIRDDILEFEAGFGSENYGSVVSIPLINIMQVIVDETLVYVNQVALFLKEYKKEVKQEAPSVSTSLEKLLSNPENKKFLK